MHGPVKPQISATSQNLFVACAAGVAIAYVLSLVVMFAGHNWLLDAQGRPLVTDFLAVWSAGNLVHNGLALSAYDAQAQHAAEAAVIGHDFKGGLGWPYPPYFLFVAAALASLSYAQSFILWVGTTLLGYAATVGMIVKNRQAIIFALVAPWVLANMMIGQNGFLTAALFGLILLYLEPRPVISGILLGLLTYKPQFGLLFPIALALGGHWRAFAYAAVTALCLVGLSSLAFGASTFAAFLQVLPQTTHTLLVEGAVGWNKLQSAYGLVRWLGLQDVAGWIAQVSVTISCVMGIACLWGSKATSALKAAGLCVAALIATPYVFVYDLPVLAIAIAFLYRDHDFDRFELCGVAFALLTVSAFMVFPAPIGLFGILVVAALVARRALTSSGRSGRLAVSSSGIHAGRTPEHLIKPGRIG